MTNCLKKIGKKMHIIVVRVNSVPNKVVGKYKNRKFSHDVQNKKGKLLTLDVSDAFFVQFSGEELWRYDMVVRYLAIENYYGLNSVGFNLYKKMQDLRIGFGYADKAVKRFEELISSYDKNGYDSDSTIIVDKKLRLIDGSHRMALAMYHKQQKISAVVINGEQTVDYSIDWFLANGFTDEEIDLIINKANKLIAMMNKPFSCVIWNPAVHLSDAMVKDIGYFGTVVSRKKYHYRQAEYKNIVRAVYAIDDIEKWKIEKKLEHMGENADTVEVVELLYDVPNYRIKAATNLPLSIRGERTKKAIRSRFQSHVDNYFFDIIMHIADNHMQSDYMWKVFEPRIDCKKIISILNRYQYALEKVDVPYYPADFPEHIPVGKDLDVVCAKEDFSKIRSDLISFAENYHDYEIVVRNFPDRLMLRFELSGKLIFLIDCCCALKGVPNEFVSLALKTRSKNPTGYYVFQPAVEALLRKAAYDDNNNKTYHLDFYKQHKKYDSYAEAIETLKGMN